MNQTRGSSTVWHFFFFGSSNILLVILPAPAKAASENVSFLPVQEWLVPFCSPPSEDEEFIQSGLQNVIVMGTDQLSIALHIARRITDLGWMTDHAYDNLIDIYAAYSFPFFFFFF